MLLRIVKEISPESAQSIVVAMTKIKRFSELEDGTFLCKDLGGAEVAAATAAREGANKAVLENIEVFAQPEYELGRGYEHLFYKKTAGEQRPRNLNFMCGTVRTYSASFGILEPGSQKMEFLLGPFVAQDADGYIFSLPGNIYELARFFHNRKGLYRKIYEVLKEKKAENSALFTPVFLEDLLLLFSANAEEEKLETFSIPEKNLSRQLLKKKVDGKNMLALGSSYFYPEQASGQEYPRSPITKIKLFLNNKNQLIINEIIDTGWKESPLKIADILEQEEFVNYTNHTLNGWLQQILAMAAFGEKIYEKVKTKILFEAL